MCGITGIFAFNPIGRIHLIHLEEATRRLDKRGPDYHDSWFDETIGLGHRRLSIIDTSSAGHQPMADQTGRYRIVFNGEVYNYKEIRSELKTRGIQFKSDCDTEVLLYAFIEWGEDCLQKLNGFFAFAIYDEKEEMLFLARDRYGIKPLLYSMDEDKVLFASEMKSILAYGIPKKINVESLFRYFELTYVPGPDTMLHQVKKLPPGHFLRIRKKVLPELKRYDEIPVTHTVSSGSWEQACTDLRGALTRSVQRRLVSDVPLGSFLSGGIDSSIISALAAREVPGFKTFSIGFKDQKYFDETSYAERVARQYQTDHHVFSLTNDDLLSEVNNVVNYIDEPFADSSALPVYILSKYTRKQVTVALSGDGADEVFSGYNKHSAWLAGLNSGFMGEVIREFDYIWKWLPQSRHHFITNRFRQLNRFAATLKLKPPERYWFLASFISQQQVRKLLKPPYLAYPEDLDIFKTQLIGKRNLENFNEFLKLDCELVLPGDMLTKVDLMSMANGLEVRVPFLDPEVVKLAFSIPQEFKIKGNKRKIILKESFKDLIPPELLDRPKHGFEVPLLGWFKRELKDELEKMVFNEDLVRSQGIFQWKEINRIKRKLHSYDPGDTPVLTWSLYVFQKWYDRYFY